MAHPDAQTDRIVRMFWLAFPDRVEASRVLAAITLMTNKLGPVHTINLMRRLASTIEKNQLNSVLSITREGAAMCVIAPPGDERTEIAMLEHVMDLLVVELRDRKARRAAHLV